jgi:hypothetical protein
MPCNPNKRLWIYKIKNNQGYSKISKISSDISKAYPVTETQE